MKSRLVPAVVGALAMGLIVVCAGAAAGVRIPNGSIGLKKLTPHLAKLVTSGGKEGPQGPAGPTGPQGEIGLQGFPGPQGPRGEKSDTPPQAVFPYSATLTPGEPDLTVALVGPLTFVASCQPEGEDQIVAKLTVTSSENGVLVNNKALEQGESRTIQELSRVVGSPEEELFFPIVRAWNTAGSFALQGVPTLVVSSLPGRCQFFGTLIEDS